MSFTVAIIGRPNVGKSTLFNRLVGKRVAIVDDAPGVTRDRREGDGRLGDLRFRVIDTAGLDDAGGEALEARMQQQTERAIAEANVVLLLTDARAGITPMDDFFADRIRRSPTPVILVANKCEGRRAEAGLLEAFSLGLGEPVAISAEHGQGLADLYDALVAATAANADRGRSEDGEGETPDGATDDDRVLQLAVVGRPNVGKSTLINRLLGEERLLTGPEAGITRDSISVSWTWRGRPLRLVDTAGLRRKARVTAKLEELSVADTFRAIRFAHVAVVVIDAIAGMEKQDLTIASRVVEEGRAPLIAINKWDLVRDRGAALTRIADRLETSLPQARGIRTVPLSALSGQGLGRLLPAVIETHDRWTARIATGPLNRWLAEVVERHAPPLAQGRRIKLRYLTQAKTRPPTFVIFASRPESLPESYTRYLVTELRRAFDLDGIPIRLLARKGRNPYAAGD